MAISVTLTPSVPATLSGSWGNEGCLGETIETFYRLWKDDVLYDSSTISSFSKSWTNVPTGNYYLEVNIIVDGSPCDSGSSVTVHSGNYCIPSNQTNIRFSELADFYDLPPTDIKLSGANNPSTGNNIFGKSALPASGTISRLTPNAVSELRGSCGGAIDAFGEPVAGDSYFRFYGQIAEDIGCGFKDDGVSNGLYYVLWTYDKATESFQYCASFDEQRGDIRQSNGTIGVDTVGSKTIKIGFTTLSSQLQLSGSVTVRRISDNAVLASANFNFPAGTNLYNNVTSVSWNNSVPTKVAVIVNATQQCIV